jgi:hypothetical protein
MTTETTTRTCGTCGGEGDCPDCDGAEPMTATDVEQMLHDHLYGIDDTFTTGVVSMRSFADAGLHTRDAGLVLRMVDGTEFQVTVVRSR